MCLECKAVGECGGVEVGDGNNDVCEKFLSCGFVERKVLSANRIGCEACAQLARLVCENVW